MSQLLLLTSALQPSAEVLPGLALLPHHVKVLPADGAALLDAPDADLLFVDLYTDHGPGVGHLAWGFLENCQKQLNPGGWLVINQWAGDDGRPLGAALLRGLYHRHYWELPVKEGNVILLVPADLEQVLDLDGVGERAAALAPRLGYSLEYLIKAIRPAT